MNRSSMLLASAGLMGCCLIWGSMTPILKELTEVMDLWLLSAARYVLGLPVLWLAWMLATRPRSHPGPMRAGQLASLGLAMGAFSVLFTFGVRHSHPVTAAIVLNTGPVIATVMAWLLLRARPPKGFAIALALSLAGAALVVIGAPGFAQRGFGFQGGEPLLIVAQICWQWYSIRAQQWLGDRGQIGLSAITSSVAGLWMFAAYAAMYGAGLAGGLPPAISALDLAYIVWVCVFGVAVAVLMWNYGVSRLSLPIASLHMNAAPVVAVTTAWVLGHAPTALQVLGGAVVLSGIIYMQSRQFARARA
jgi:drug/metabolite transporter (DMT)-like permease